MNYLIICPKFVENLEDYYPFPVGIAYINASLKQKRDTVHQLNLNYRKNILEAVEQAIMKNQIHCVIIGGTSLMYNQIHEITTFVKKIAPQVVTIVGGGLITASPELAMEGLPGADIGIMGEGEYTIQELADAIENQLNLKDIDGIIFRRDNQTLCKTKNRGDIQDLDALPFPDYEGFEYNSELTDWSEEIISHEKFFIEKPICASRSCPYNCTFCFHTCGKTYRVRSLDNIFAEIDELVRKYQIEYLMIADELFVCYEDRVFEFCERIKPYHLKWRTSARVDTVTPEILERMKDAGCYQIGFGIESANNQILKGMKKNITIEQIEWAFKAARQAGLQTVGGFLFGDKNETFETFKGTLTYWRDHPEYDLGCYRVIVLPGSELYDYALKNEYIADELDYWRKGFPYFNLTKMSDEEYLESLYMMDDILAKKIYLPNSYKLLEMNVKQKKIKMEIECKNCLNVYTVQENEFTGDYIFNYYCPRCGQHHCSPAYNLLKDEMDQALSERLKNEKLYVYGIGRSVRRFMHLCEVFKSDNVVLLDADPLKQKLGILGKKIHAPEYLTEMKVTEVINGATMVAQIALINDYLRSAHPLVENITNFNDFLFNLIDQETFDK